MKVTLIYPDIIRQSSWSGYYYMGAGYLAAALKRADHKVSFLHITHPVRKEPFVKSVDKAKPDLVAFSSTTNMFRYVREWARWLREENYKDLILCGGVHPTLNPEEVLCCSSDVDAVCIGEGEEALVELCDRMAKGREIFDIANIWIKDSGKIIRNRLRPLVENLDNLPFPDREVFDFSNLELSKKERGLFMASRGCPYDCAYCCNHSLKEATANDGDYVRFRSVDNLMEEIKTVVKNYPWIKTLHFDDDILPLKRRWFEEFAHAYKSQIGLLFSCNLRADLASERTIELLKYAGCYQVQMGIESGNEGIRNVILGRSLSNEELLEAFRLCREAGIKTLAYNMVGMPDESIREVLDTVKLNAKARPDYFSVSYLYPYPKTRIYDMCKEKGLLTTRDIPDYFESTALAISPIFMRQIMFIRMYFRILVGLYRFLYKFPCGEFFVKTLDNVLSSRLAAYLVFPLAGATYSILRTAKGLLKRVLRR